MERQVLRDAIAQLEQLKNLSEWEPQQDTELLQLFKTTFRAIHSTIFHSSRSTTKFAASVKNFQLDIENSLIDLNNVGQVKFLQQTTTDDPIQKQGFYSKYDSEKILNERTTRDILKQNLEEFSSILTERDLKDYNHLLDSLDFFKDFKLQRLEAFKNEVCVMKPGIDKFSSLNDHSFSEIVSLNDHNSETFSIAGEYKAQPSEKIADYRNLFADLDHDSDEKDKSIREMPQASNLQQKQPDIPVSRKSELNQSQKTPQKKDPIVVDKIESADLKTKKTDVERNIPRRKEGKRVKPSISDKIDKLFEDSESEKSDEVPHSFTLPNPAKDSSLKIAKKVYS